MHLARANLTPPPPKAKILVWPKIQELIDELSSEAKKIRGKSNQTPKDLQTVQDRFMITFWLHYPVRNDLQHTRIIARRAFY